jgi:hypothetical protein
MPRKSKVKQLPKEFQEAIHKLLDGGQTLDAILEHLKGLGAEVSRSSLGRYSQEYQNVAAKLREAREITSAFAADLANMPNDMGRVTTELLHSIVFKVLMRQHEGESPDVSAEELMFLARSIKDMASANKTSADLEIKVRDRAREQALHDAAKAVDTAGKEKGLTAETVKAIKASILGVK